MECCLGSLKQVGEIMNSDPIANLLTMVRNALKAQHPKVDVPASRMKVAIADIWKKYGFIKNYKLYRQDSKGVLRIYFKYAGKNRPVIQGLERVSKPSCRVYCSWRQLPKVLGGVGVAIVSTPKGVLSDDVARENKVGGEVLCKVW